MGYTLLDKLGQGGMGVVWRARDDESGEIVALKLLHVAYAGDPEYVVRFEREMEIAKRIHSPHVVKVLGYGEREGAPYIAFEFVDGPSLRQKLSEHGPFSWPDARTLMMQLAEGLADAHAAGVVHRDLKPSNVLIARGGTAKLADFGISRAVDMAALTRASGLLGTPAYLAPEGPLDARSDLYSLGVIAFELLTGAPPFEGESYQEVLIAHMRQAPDISKLPAEARPIVAWLLEKDPNRRPQAARQLIRVLTGAESIGAGAAGAGIPDLTLVRRPADALAAAAATDDATLVRSPAGEAAAEAPTVVRRRKTVGTGDTTVPGRAAALPVVAAPTAPPPLAASAPQLLPEPARRSSKKPLLVAGLAVLVIVGAVAGFGLSSGSIGGARATNQSSASDPLAAVTAKPTPTRSPTPTPSPTPMNGPGTWAAVGQLPVSIWGQGAQQLSGGKVLIFGTGQRKTDTNSVASWLFDPATRSLQNAGPMAKAQALAGVVLLQDGSVLAVGGMTSAGGPVADVQRYDPGAGGWSIVAPLGRARTHATVTVLNDGRVLVAGGWVSYTNRTWTATNSAEIFDPVTSTWADIAPMNEPRALHTATLLPDGRVLVAGGAGQWSGGASNARKTNIAIVQTAEIFDPTAGTWTYTGKMTFLRATHAAVLLANGHVLVAGGWGGTGHVTLNTAEDFDPGTGKWATVGGMKAARGQLLLETLPSGRVLACGGDTYDWRATGACEIYDPLKKQWGPGTTMPLAIYWPATAVLADGGILTAGGSTTSSSIGGISLFTEN